jgi:hypothetical protein
MPIFIAHRGNTNGIELSFENRIDYLGHALSIGYGIECDVCYWKDKYYFGHDAPQEEIDTNILLADNSFCHAKDMQSLLYLNSIGANCFWHESDKMTYTSKGNIWCYPGVFPISKNAVWLDLLGIPLPENIHHTIYGICGDTFINTI